MPAKSKAQQRYFGYLLSNPDERKKEGVSRKVAREFAGTKHKGLPEKVKEGIDEGIGKALKKGLERDKKARQKKKEKELALAAQAGGKGPAGGGGLAQRGVHHLHAVQRAVRTSRAWRAAERAAREEASWRRQQPLARLAVLEQHGLWNVEPAPLVLTPTCRPQRLEYPAPAAGLRERHPQSTNCASALHGSVDHRLIPDTTLHNTP